MKISTVLDYIDICVLANGRLLGQRRDGPPRGGENGKMCAFYPSRKSVSGILDNPATKWDRAGEPGGSLFLFRRRGSRSRSRAGRGISLNSTHQVNIIRNYQT